MTIMEKKMAAWHSNKPCHVEEVKSLQWTNKENEGTLCYHTLVNLI